ncbi:MAG: HNH endonuclease signature motif containing protein [Verrucomicrobiota bacterium]
MKACAKCGSLDFGTWKSSSTGRVSRYCRACRRLRANAYTKRKIKNGGSHTRKEWLAKLALYQICPRCGRPWGSIPPRPDKRYRNIWTKDHIVPLTNGGSDDIQNLQPLCYRCNSSKCDEKRKARLCAG